MTHVVITAPPPEFLSGPLKLHSACFFPRFLFWPPPPFQHQFPNDSSVEPVEHTQADDMHKVYADGPQMEACDFTQDIANTTSSEGIGVRHSVRPTRCAAVLTRARRTRRLGCSAKKTLALQQHAVLIMRWHEPIHQALEAPFQSQPQGIER